MKERNILWVFLAFVLGFLLPVCSCGSMCFLSVASLGLLAEGEGSPIATGPAVAVIRLNGVIGSDPADSFSSAGITPGSVDNQLTQAAGDPDVKAVVLRINSPGGSVVASNQIYHMLKEFEKPVVVWMDEMAASGGYYIACGADYMVAHPDTLTGSIGVISEFINADELLEEVWDYKNYPTTRTVDNHVLSLRAKLERKPGEPRHLITVHGVGYKFVE